MPTASPRPNQDLFNADRRAWYQQQVNANPSYQLPPGWKLENGQVVEDVPWLKKYSGYFPLAALAAAGGLGLAGVGGAGAASGAAAVEPSIATGVIPGAVPSSLGAAPAVTGASAGGLGSLSTANLLKLGSLAPSVAGLFMGGGSNANAGQMQGINDLMNYQKRLLAMTDPSAASSLGIPVPQGAVPMRQAMLRGIYSMMPVFAKQGLNQPTTEATTPTMTPTTGETSRRPRPRY